jgi:cysteine desulfurase
MPQSAQIYLDNNSTTPTDPRVVEAMLPYFTTLFGNSSSSHQFGSSIQNQVSKARESVAEFISCEPSDLIFTSGSTEAINLAVIGYALRNGNRGKHLITSKTEHKAVLEIFQYLESIGFETTYLNVDEQGNINLAELAQSFRRDTILVSVMYSNNETGVINPILKIAEISKSHKCAFFCDATQAIGKIPIDVTDLGIDMMAFSAHKFYGPKGVGALFINGLKKKPLKLQPIYFGGGHEGGIRSGTQNVPGVIGLSKACELARSEMFNDKRRLLVLRDSLEEELLSITGSFVNGDRSKRLYNVSNICFPGIDANALINQLQNISLSNGSACTAAIVEPSHVLKAMGLSDYDANSSIRFSLGRFNTEEELKIAIPLIKESITKDQLRYAKLG